MFSLAAQQEFLDSFFETVQPFDCFVLAGWRPKENDLSDAIAALFEPGWKHGFSAGILAEVLQKAGSQPSLSQAAQTAISHICSLDLRDDDLKVVREHWGAESRADIEIWGPDFFICLEHKKGSGETVIGGRYQTARLRVDAIDMAARFSIPEEHGQAIEQRGRHLGIPEHAGPFAKGQVRGDDN